MILQVKCSLGINFDSNIYKNVSFSASKSGLSGEMVSDDWFYPSPPQKKCPKVRIMQAVLKNGDNVR